jgi:hypothetical protein
MREWIIVLGLFSCLQASVKDEKDLLQGIEHALDEPLVTKLVIRDPFSWPAMVRQVKMKSKITQTPALGWSLTGISATKRGLYALIDDGKQTKLARVAETLGNGWTVSAISEQGMVCKHSTGCTQELRV